MVQVWGARRGKLQLLAKGARGKPQMHTEEHGQRETEIEELKWESGRD